MMQAQHDVEIEVSGVEGLTRGCIDWFFLEKINTLNILVGYVADENMGHAC